MPEKKPVTITLDRERVVFYDTNAICLAEEAMGRGVVEVIAGLRKARNLSFRDARALLWAGLTHEDPSLTLEGLGILFRPSLMPKVVLAIVPALNDFFSEAG